MCLLPSLQVSLHENILRHLYGCVHTIVSTYISKEWISMIISTCISKEWNYTIIITRISMEYIPTTSLWRIPTVTPIPSKPEMFVQGIYSKPEILLQNIWKFKILSKEVKPESSKLWLLLHASLQSYTKLFYQYIGYYVVNKNTNNNTRNIRKQVVGYIMLLKRKQSTKVKAKGYTEGHYY